jgi:hypothetical protein
MTRHCFIVTSAINSRFGIYSPKERLAQTLDTIQSIHQHAPGSKIIIMECTGVPLTDEQSEVLEANSDVFIDYTTDAAVQAIYNGSDNWDVVKNSTEIMCFGRTIAQCQSDGDFDDVDRIHKMSGRYLLNDDFNLSLYNNNHNILIGPKHTSQFPFEITQTEAQYMARLWSWPSELTDEIVQVYEDSLNFFAERVARGGYTDIEHVLYRFLNPAHVQEVPLLGVEGAIAPNGAAIKN